MFQDTDEGVIISLLVIPKSSKSEIIGNHNNSLKIKIKAPPIDGKANAEIIRFLAEFLDIPKRHIAILKGDKSKLKKVIIFNKKTIDLMSKLLTTL